MISSGLRIGLACAFLCFAGSSAMAKPPYGVARVDLGSSGARLFIRSTAVLNEPGADHRVLTLISASGKRRVLALKDGGGRLGNNRIFLHAVDDDFLLLSEKDCVLVDPLKSTFVRCPVRPPCTQKGSDKTQFVGSFDWMNGYDPPHGEFMHRFRYLPFYDAPCSG